MKSKPNAAPSVSFVSLGCFKNTVDTEVLGGILEKNGLRLVSSYEPADWLVLNTCSFIQDAKQESIDEILAALEKKERGEVKHIAVFGCLPQRYLQELQSSFPGVDIMWGVNDLDTLAHAIARTQRPQYADDSLFLYDERYRRIVTTLPNTTFIKISEGCDMTCSFCAIPAIRGPYRSRTIDSILREAESFRQRGFVELNLISQNSTYFGRDRAGHSQLPELLERVSALGFDWVRVLYLMPEEVTAELVAAFDRPTLLPYFDLPFQHVAPAVLQRMKRGGGSDKNLALVASIRRAYPQAVLRSSFIVGFPGERDEDFEELAAFARDSRIEHMGVFGYSDEENTAAFALEGKLDPILIQERKECLLDVSDENLRDYHAALKGSAQQFLPHGPWDNNRTIGRIAGQAPEVDGFTVIKRPFDDDYSLRPIRIVSFKNELLFGECP
jgi:ribosomal protein S12 methylthiotransferase